MKIELDVHTHTIASGHAFSTLQEMAQAAADKGLKVLGITEHSPGVPGTCHPIYFRNLHVVPRRMYGVELLLGAEINILDGKGNLDLDEDYMKMLDIRIAGIHSLCYEYGTIEETPMEWYRLSAILLFILSVTPETVRRRYILNRWYWQPKNTILYWK